MPILTGRNPVSHRPLARAESAVIVFVHMLKAGGTTLREVVQPLYGDRLLRDYDDIPMSNRPEHAVQRAARAAALQQNAARLDADIVFGHFVMSKYRGLRPDLRFGTMFRDPAARIVSHYFHYLRNRGGPRNELLPDGITLAEFSALPNYADMYRYLLGDVAVQELAYVGITEEFNASVELFFRVFGIRPPAPATDQPPPQPKLNRASEYLDATEWLQQQGLADAVRASQAVNYAIYAQARQRFADLCHRYGVVRRDR